LDLLEKDGLSIDLLSKLSYRSVLNLNLKQDLHYFNKAELLSEIEKVIEWYDATISDYEIPIDYRIKSVQSATLKYQRYFPDHQARKVFNDLLGFRSLCDNYDEVLSLASLEGIRFADMTKGKAIDDGYRGIHVYYQRDSRSYPIEIQYNTYYDRQLNNWLHAYLYKREYPDTVGQTMRKAYECGRIHNENDFKEVLESVLSDCQGY